MRVTIAPIQPAKNIKLKIDKSKYNIILTASQKNHDMQLHAMSQMAFSPILLLLWNSVHIKETKSISRLWYKNYFFIFCYSVHFLILFLWVYYQYTKVHYSPLARAREDFIILLLVFVKIYIHIKSIFTTCNFYKSDSFIFRRSNYHSCI